MNNKQKQRSNIFNDLMGIDNSIDSFLETNSRKQPIVFFGAGFALTRMLLKMERFGFNIACICDNDKSKQGALFENRYEVLSLDDCIIRFPTALYVISAPLYFEDIQRILEAKISKERISDVDFECGHYFSGRDFKSYFLQNIRRFEGLYNLLCDDISKTVLYKVTRAHFSGKREDFASACSGEDDWYLFKSLLSPRPNSVYLDCGVYDGDTIKLFNTAAKNGYKSILAFEPDESIYPKLLSTISNNNITNVQIIKKGTYDHNGKLRFNPSGVYSSIVNSNKSLQPQIDSAEIDVTTIDSVLDGEFADIIKMDIEGAEYKALLGAKNTIIKHKPRLAICLYHNIEDFLEIPELIISLVPEYKLFLRHHSKSCTDTILYAVP